MEIAPNVHEVRHTICNSFLIVDNAELTLIDAGITPAAKHIIEYIERLGHQLTDLKRILITHTDSDHVRGLPTLIEKSAATVSTSFIEGQALAEGKPSRPLKLRGLTKFFIGIISKLVRIPKIEGCEVLIAGQVLRIMGRLEVLGTPGHTPEHLSYYLKEEGILFAGDSLRTVNDEIIISSGMNTWDEDQAEESAELQAELGPKIVCVGHGTTVFNAELKIPKRYPEKS